jgi:hypothetical protein
MALTFDHEKQLASSSHHGGHVYKLADAGTYGSFSISTKSTTQNEKKISVTFITVKIFQ